MAISIRKMSPSDAQGVGAIQLSSAPDSASGWTTADFLNQNSWVAVDDAGAIQGYLVAHQIAPDEYEILDMAIALEHRRHGIGRALLAHVLERFPGKWFLEVRASNQAACKLYECAGFRASRRRREYYQSPAEDAIEMTNHS